VELLHDFRERASLRNITLRLVGIPEPTVATSHH
jgi:hypothetical protein